MIIVFDVTNRNSFMKVQDWIESVFDNTDKTISMILVGNKIDKPRDVSTQEGKKMADAYKIKYFETSAKDNIGIDESMLEIITLVVNSKKKIEDNNIEITKDPNPSSSNCKC